MSQSYEYPPPPSPRNFQHSPGISNVVSHHAGSAVGHGVGNFQGYAPHEQRTRILPVAPPTITTTFDPRVLVNASATPLSAHPGTPSVNYRALQPRQNLTAPASALTSRSASSPLTQTSISPASASPMEPYNPRQWTGVNNVSGTQMVFARPANQPISTRDTTGMEAALPSPPPPYTPDPSDDAATAMHTPGSRISSMMETMYPSAPAALETPARHSPLVPMSPAFPPPPAGSSRHRERSLSGIGAQRSIFGHLRGKQNARNEPPQIVPSPSPPVIEARPPAARRAASAGHYHSTSSHLTQERQPVEPSWQPGMPLPGPPPGPPPAGSRSQSLNRIPGVSVIASSSSSTAGGSESSTSTARGPARRAAARSTLGPVPPTPANWVDQDSITVSASQSTEATNQPEQAVQPLRIDTSSGVRDSLARRPATRDTSQQGIRERRSRSRQARYGEIMSPDGDESRPSDLVFPTTHGSISQRREFGRVKPGGAASAPTSANLVPPTSSNRPNPSSVMTPPYTPAVNDGDAGKKGLRVPSSASIDRPVSHLLHAPNDDVSMQAPLSPVRPPSAGAKPSTAKLDAFAVQALERHRDFVHKEANAASDEERLEIFTSYMVHESRLRRDRYATAYNAMAGDIVDMTRDMWRSYVREGKRVMTPSTAKSTSDPTPSWATDGQRSARLNGLNSASSFGEMTPRTEPTSASDRSESLERTESRQWGEVFKPSLSPIPSMAVSTANDDGSSRGRQPSRWWEQSVSGGSIGRPDRITRTHRETKYMGVDPASFVDIPQDSPREQAVISTPAGSSQGYGPDEYPPEKVGWHDDVELDTPMPTPGRRPRKASDPGFDLLDVSRLVTLPPPYPRHHPAVNNSHPLLNDLRTSHRQLADHSDIQKIKDGYLDQDYALQRSQQEASKERKARLRTSIQGKISSGEMTFAEAAKAEAKFEQEEPDRAKANARAMFDLYEASVASPLNVLLTDRLAQADASLKQLQDDLDKRNERSDPNQAQEEGDNQPERLEKLTLFKWIFEAREQLHKEMYELHSQRSEKYSEVILTPYRIGKLQNKIDEATAFFQKDARDRSRAFVNDSLKRFESLQSVIESNVTRGVEDQLSAFWDIAPSLNNVIQTVPSDRAEFELAIPQTEYEENPAYHDHPLQYLYSLLSHAEKSAFQFIESQTNLLCLLHEVRTATAKSRLRSIEQEQTAAATSAEDEAALKAEMVEAGKLEEERLTDDLKDKVGEVEGQWREALGDSIGACKGKVRGWLEESGGWEDGLDE